MSIEENKAMIFHIVDECNKGNLEVINECFDDNFVRYQDGTAPGSIPTLDRQGYKNMVAAVCKSCPDIQLKINEMVAEDDRVAFRWTLTGTETGGSTGKPPTGKPFSVTEDYFVRFEGGKIVEFRNLYGGQTG